MILKIANKIGCGAYADIFRAPQEIVVYKLFISGKHPTNQSQDLTEPEDDDRRQKTFVSECEAYRLASKHSFLAKHVPRFFRPCVIHDVVGSAGSVAEQFMLDHCYSMEYIDGVPVEIGELFAGNCPVHVERALQAFRECGIKHLLDASVFFAHDPNNFKFIDFAVEEFQPSL
jgi:hypothetical protein